MMAIEPLSRSKWQIPLISILVVWDRTSTALMASNPMPEKMVSTVRGLRQLTTPIALEKTQMITATIPRLIIVAIGLRSVERRLKSLT